MYSHHYLTLLVCLSWTLAASQRCSKTIEDVCDHSNATKKSEFYALQLSSQEYSATENGKMQISVEVKTTATCLTLQTPGPKYYKLEAYSKSSSEPVGIFNTPHQSSEAERCANNEIVFSSCDPKVTDLPRVYGWTAPNFYAGDICFRLTIVKDGENSTCEQVTKCISSADSMPVSGDGVQEMMASGEKEKHNDGVLETTLDTSDTAEYYDSTRYEACLRRRNCTFAKRKTMCASDNKEYPSRCHVKLEACLTGHNIKVLHPGKCEPPSPPPVGPCFEDRQQLLKIGSAAELGWIPSCDCNGFHKPVQCNTVTNKCWCSTKIGALRGDRVPFNCGRVDFSRCLLTL